MTDDGQGQDEQRVAEIRARLEAATPGPWGYNSYSGVFGPPELCGADDGPDYPESPRPTPGSSEDRLWVAQRSAAYEADPRICKVPALYGDTAIGRHKADAEFISHAREDVPWLLARLAALAAERDEWKRINQSDNQCAARRLAQDERISAISHWECCNCGRTWDHTPESVETLFCRSGNGACAETAVTWQSRALEAERRRHLDLTRLDALAAERDRAVELRAGDQHWARHFKAKADDLLARLAAAEAALAPCTLAREYRDGVTCRDERDDKGVCFNHRVVRGLRVHAVTADRLELENRALRRQVRATYGIIHEGLHGGKPTDPEHQELCERPACRNARAALAGSTGGQEREGEGE